MGLEINKNDIVISKIDKERLLYAISIADSLVKSKNSNKISGDLDSIWRICGYPSIEKFQNLFKQYKRMTLSEYCKKLNPNCVC